MRNRNGWVSAAMIGLAVCIAAGGLNLFAGSAAGAAGRGACADDVDKFCKDVQPGGGRIARCLKQHEAELSPVCKERIAEVKKKAKEFHQACEDDVLRLCQNVAAGGGRILRCLKEHEAELSPDCKGMMAQGKRK